MPPNVKPFQDTNPIYYNVTRQLEFRELLNNAKNSCYLILLELMINCFAKFLRKKWKYKADK